MDEAYMPFALVVHQLTAFGGEVVDDAAGVRSIITGCEIESPVELDVSRTDAGALVVGSTPPLYPLLTTIQPSYHRMRLRLELTGEVDGGT